MAGKKILIVDDDRMFLKILTDALTPHGYEIFTAPSGAHALEAFKKVKPDMLLIDALLPQMDGFQVCARIREDEAGKKIPIVMMTAIYKSKDREREARDIYRVKEYLQKPIDLAVLLKVIGQITS